MSATPPPQPTRSTAAERREHLVEAAICEFAQRGYEGGSTKRIASAVGISQPYVFRLFDSKLQLFLAAVERCMEDTLEMFQEAAGGLRDEEALVAIGRAYGDAIIANPTRLQLQLVAYAACDIPEVRTTTRDAFGRLVRFIETLGDYCPERIARFFAKGMLLNVITAMQIPGEPVDWGARLLAGTRPPWSLPVDQRE